MTDIKVKGMKELSEFLKQLPEKVKNNVMRGALNAGAKVIRDEAKRNVPTDTSQLKDGIKTGTRLKGDTVIAKVKTTGPHAFLAQWMEFGVAGHTITSEAGGVLIIGNDVFVREVDHPGLSPRPFIIPAMESHASQAVVAAAHYIQKRLTKAGIAAAGDVDIEPEDAA